MCTKFLILQNLHLQTKEVISHLKDYIFDLAPQCSEVGGDPVALNAKFTCHDSEVMQLKHIPFCIGQIELRREVDYLPERYLGPISNYFSGIDCAAISHVFAPPQLKQDREAKIHSFVKRYLNI